MGLFVLFLGTTHWLDEEIARLRLPALRRGDALRAALEPENLQGKRLRQAVDEAFDSDPIISAYRQAVDQAQALCEWALLFHERRERSALQRRLAKFRLYGRVAA